MRLIDADALTPFIDGYGKVVYYSDIQNAPTIDAVPVVRCCACKFVDFDVMFQIAECKNKQGLRGNLRANGFCSYGAKMEDKP